MISGIVLIFQAAELINKKYEIQETLAKSLIINKRESTIYCERQAQSFHLKYKRNQQSR